MLDKWLFPASSYENNHTDVLVRLKTMSYAGINGLQAAGFTVRRMSVFRTTPQFPELAFWLHPGADLPNSLIEAPALAAA